jgi:hypothetical protein
MKVLEVNSAMETILIGFEDGDDWLLSRVEATIADFQM